MSDRAPRLCDLDRGQVRAWVPPTVTGSQGGQGPVASGTRRASAARCGAGGDDTVVSAATQRPPSGGCRLLAVPTAPVVTALLVCRAKGPGFRADAAHPHCDLCHSGPAGGRVAGVARAGGEGRAGEWRAGEWRAGEWRAGVGLITFWRVLPFGWAEFPPESVAPGRGSRSRPPVFGREGRPRVGRQPLGSRAGSGDRRRRPPVALRPDQPQPRADWAAARRRRRRHCVRTTSASQVAAGMTSAAAVSTARCTVEVPAPPTMLTVAISSEMGPSGRVRRLRNGGCQRMPSPERPLSPRTRPAGLPPPYRRRPVTSGTRW